MKNVYTIKSLIPSKRGGKRFNAGRKNKHYTTKVLCKRIPDKIYADIEAYIDDKIKEYKASIGLIGSSSHYQDDF